MAPMSKYFAALILALPLILQLFNNCRGQDIDVTIAVRSISPPVVEIHGRFAGTQPVSRNFAISREYAGITGLADRITNLHLEDSAEKSVAYKKFMSGEFVADSDFVSWAYKMDLSPFKSAETSAHTSWIGPSVGLLFLSDLLPAASKNKEYSANVNIELPFGWSVSGEKSNFKITNVQKAVVLIARSVREYSIPFADIKLQVFLNGEW